MPKPMFNIIAVIGLGLIGSSFSQAVRRGGLAGKILGIDTSEAVQNAARELGIVDEILSPTSPDLSKAELIFLSAPVEAMKSAVNSVCKHLVSGTIITDAGSAKVSVISEIGELIPTGVHFIPGHPIVSSEQYGPYAGFAELFEKRLCILTPTPDTDRNAIKRVEALWNAIGCDVELMTAEHHDRIFAITGNLPHIFASSLLAGEFGSITDKDITRYSTALFGDFTHPARLDPFVWANLHIKNKDAVLEILGLFSEDLSALQRAIRLGDRDMLFDFFRHTRSVIGANQITKEPNLSHHSELMRLGSENTSLRGLEIPIGLVSQSVVSLIDQQRELVRGNNSLDPRLRDEQLNALDSLKEIVQEAPSLPDRLEQGDLMADTWLSRFRSELEDNFAQTFGAENIAKATLPAAIILGCGAIGALVAGPVGFGTGSVLGHLITGQMKPGTAADKASDALRTGESDA